MKKNLKKNENEQNDNKTKTKTKWTKWKDLKNKTKGHEKKNEIKKNKIIYKSSTTGLPILFSEITKPQTTWISKWLWHYGWVSAFGKRNLLYFLYLKNIWMSKQFAIAQLFITYYDFKSPMGIIFCS